jgi:hypothetical protein
MKNCKACQHPDRDEINRSMAEGVADRAIGRRFGMAGVSVRRHRMHMAAVLPISSEVTGAITALEHSTWLVGRLRKIAERCDGVADRQFLEAADRLDKSIRTYGLLTKEITPGGQQLNVFFSEMGVRDGAEIRRALDVVREGREAPLDEVLEDALAAIRLVLTQRPELRQHAIDVVGRFSYAEVTNGEETNGKPAHAPRGAQAPAAV